VGYEQPLAYLLGVEGLALLRAFGGEHDREFVEARLREVRTLLADPALAEGVATRRVATVDGYRLWAHAYDGPNSAFAVDEPVLAEILDELPPGPALDAACGTGRYAALLAGRGHRVVGVDASPDMLDHARKRLPDVEFLRGELTALPVEDTSVDLVTCGLALTHVPSLGPVFAEFARVLRPGGHVVVADMHPERVLRGAVPPLRDEDGLPVRLPAHRHLVGDYLRAALAAGMRVRRCVEPVLAAPPGPTAAEPAERTDPGPWDVWPWSLAALVPEATAAADAGVPVMVVWEFVL
jgi:SAM-dependent methyltransferase